MIPDMVEHQEKMYIIGRDQGVGLMGQGQGVNRAILHVIRTGNIRLVIGMLVKHTGLDHIVIQEQGTTRQQERALL